MQNLSSNVTSLSPTDSRQKPEMHTTEIMFAELTRNVETIIYLAEDRELTQVPPFNAEEARQYLLALDLISAAREVIPADAVVHKAKTDSVYQMIMEAAAVIDEAVLKNCSDSVINALTEWSTNRIVNTVEINHLKTDQS